MHKGGFGIMDYGVNIVKYLMILLHEGLQITKATLPSCYWKVSMNKMI